MECLLSVILKTKKRAEKPVHVPTTSFSFASISSEVSFLLNGVFLSSMSQ